MVNYEGIIVMVHIVNKCPQFIKMLLIVHIVKYPQKVNRPKLSYVIFDVSKYVKPSNQIKESHWPGKKKKKESAQLHTTLSIEYLKRTVPFYHFHWSYKLVTDLPNP